MLRRRRLILIVVQTPCVQRLRPDRDQVRRFTGPLVLLAAAEPRLTVRDGQEPTDPLECGFAANIVAGGDAASPVGRQVHGLYEALDPHFPQYVVIAGIDVEQRLKAARFAQRPFWNEERFELEVFCTKTHPWTCIPAQLLRALSQKCISCSLLPARPIRGLGPV